MNYYDTLIQRIDALINEKKYTEAKALIDEELSMPYVPMDAMDKLNDFKDELKSLMPKEIRNHILLPQELVPALKKDNDSAMQALSTLSQVNLRNYLDELKEALNDVEISHIMKNILIEQMIYQQIDEDIVYQDGIQRTIYPNQMTPVLKQSYISKAANRLAQLVSNNPSFLDQCYFVLSNAAYDRYPDEVKNDDIESLVFSIIRYVCLAYEDEALWRQYRDEYTVDEKSLETFAF